jgi:hypothetical protein
LNGLTRVDVRDTTGMLNHLKASLNITH